VTGGADRLRRRRRRRGGALPPRGGRQRPAKSPSPIRRIRNGWSRSSGAHRRRLRLPHRPAPAPRSRLDPVAMSTSGAAVLREPRPELGARRHDQGAPGRRRHRRGRGLPRRAAPYVWRKYSTTPRSPTSTRSSARSTPPGHGEIAVAGHNIKLGRGGIREIEFFVQTQQLIAGGRDPSCAAAHARRCWRRWPSGGWIDAATRDDLPRPTLVPARVEHRLQMVADEQTHTLPEDDEGLRIAAHGRLRRRMPSPRAARRSLHACATLRRSVRGGAELTSAGQPGLHRRRRRSRHAEDADALGFASRSE
jgi:hypothetical protein